MSNSNIPENKDEGYLDLLPLTDAPNTSANKFHPQIVITPVDDAATTERVRETPIRSFGESEWNEDFYRRYSLDGESFEDFKVRFNEAMRSSRKAAIRLLSESDKPTSVFAGSVAMNNEVDVMLTINKEQGVANQSACVFNLPSSLTKAK